MNLVCINAHQRSAPDPPATLHFSFSSTLSTLPAFYSEIYSRSRAPAQTASDPSPFPPRSSARPSKTTCPEARFFPTSSTFSASPNLSASPAKIQPPAVEFSTPCLPRQSSLCWTPLTFTGRGIF